ncbi:TonB-dependent receptor [Alkalilimnicola ehrlichii MLHE-1]|uniref:TonB-dependent receptor n=2 Tax=Alkalilimnicola ehrlichii TaxID=351052 RepID=Q0A6B9_ALKEH|nr:TonB-dependent receptor [Alkalilimnicola ehrlichii MLHE-1]
MSTQPGSIPSRRAKPRDNASRNGRPRWSLGPAERGPRRLGLLLGAAMLGFAGMGQAGVDLGAGGADGQAAYGLAPVVVTAPTRSERARQRSPGSVEVITAEQLQRSGATLLDEALRSHSGIFVSADGTGHSVRGAAREDTVILIDGRRVLGEPSRRYELNRIPTHRIERIEIVKGPGSVLYGSDALGGVINIVTRRPRPGLQGSVAVQAGARARDGEAARYDVGFNLLGGSADTQFTLFGEASHRDGYQQEATAPVRVGPAGNRVAPSSDEAPGWVNQLDLPDEYTIDEFRRDEADVHTLGGSLEHWFSDRFSVRLDASHLWEERRRDFINAGRTNTALAHDDGYRPVFNVPVRWLDDNRRWEVAASADWQATAGLALNHRIHYSRYEKDRSVAVIPYRDLGFESREESDFQGRDVTLIELTNEFLSTWTPVVRHTVQAGFEHRDLEYRDNVEGQEDSSRWQAGVFAQHEWQATERLDIIYGARFDDASVGGDNTSVEGGVVYALAPQASLRVNYAQGFKYPDLRALSADTRTPRGDWMLGADVIREGIKDEAHALAPEQSENVELGVRGHLGDPAALRLRYDFSGFYTAIEDRIARVRETDEYRTFRNIGTSRTRGLEAALETDWSPRLGTDLTATWIEDASWGRVSQAHYRHLPNAPELTAMVTLRWQATQALHLQTRARYVGAYHTAADDDERQASHTLVGVSASYRPAAWQGVRLHAAVDNLFNEDNDSSLYADPGRFLRAGATYQF